MQDASVIIEQANRLDYDLIQDRNLKVQNSVHLIHEEDPRSEADLGFMTEVDAVYKQPIAHVSQLSERILSTEMSENEGTASMPQNNRSSIMEIEKAEFKQVIKELINKEQ